MTTTVTTTVDPSPDKARVYTTLSWLIGPTVIFGGWFLMLFIAGTQVSGTERESTIFGWVALTAFIAAVPLIIVGLAGAALTLYTVTFVGQKRLSLVTLGFNGIIFAVYFGMFGITGSIPSNGIPVTPATLLILAPLSVIVLIPPLTFFILAWRALNPNSEPHPHNWLDLPEFPNHHH